MTEEITNEEVVERPEGLPEKFTDVAAMAASYSELEKKLGSQTPAEIAPKVEEPAVVEETAQFNINDYYEEWATNGDLSPESYEKCAAQGYSHAQIQRIAQLEKAAKESEANALYDTIEGGAETYTNAIAWAQDNLDTAYADAFNAARQQGGINQQLMINDLVGKWKEAGGEVAVEQGSSIENVPSAAGRQVDIFDSQEAINAVINSPEYQRDPAFREKAQAKIMRSLNSN